MARNIVEGRRGDQPGQEGNGRVRGVLFTAVEQISQKAKKARNKLHQIGNRRIVESQHHSLSVRRELSSFSISSLTVSVDERLTRRSSALIDPRPLPLLAQPGSNPSNFTYHIEARLYEDDVKNSVPMLASLDTQCPRNLMSLRIWQRITKGREWNLEPCGQSVVPLESKPFPVIGIAQRVMWKFSLGCRTYISEFYIVDMARWDVLIGTPTITDEDLLTLRDDGQLHSSRVLSSEGVGMRNETLSFSENEGSRRGRQDEGVRPIQGRNFLICLVALWVLFAVIFQIMWMGITRLWIEGVPSAFIILIIVELFLVFFLQVGALDTGGL